jgi:hypothetical protein
MSRSHVKFSKTSEQPFRLVPGDRGVHKFGGRCEFAGIVPEGGVPVQQLLLIDLNDADVPFQAQPRVRYLPLLYPFKYGTGGPDIQYAIVSDAEVEILYLSDPTPDEPDSQYLQVDELPEQPLTLRALSYEEARCLAFMDSDGYFQPNPSDRKILDTLDCNHLIRLGGRRQDIRNAASIVCRNPACEMHEQRTSFKFVASVPPIPVNGADEFWHEFQGGDVDFCFVLCHYCGTVIAFNVAG